MLDSFATATEMVAALRPDEPFYCLRPHVITATARRFVEGFPGDVLYAVKCNDNPLILQAIHRGGVRHFDTASLAEVAQIDALFDEQTSHYMHPVKSRRSVDEAYRRYGIRSFAIDHASELDKLIAVTGGDELTVVVRLKTARNQAVCDLGGKFGASVDEAAGLLRAARDAGCRVGLTFHVGSQCLSPDPYRRAIELAGRAMRQSGVALDVLDVGGGFPAAYVDVQPPAIECYFSAIAEATSSIDLPAGCRLQCEPGRGLVADGCSIVARVEMRRDNALYLNDGLYGGLSDLSFDGIVMPMRVIRQDGTEVGEGAPRSAPFQLFGPTCDSADKVAGPFWLDDTVDEGDWIEIGQAGAYSNVLATGFNGFRSGRAVIVEDDAFHPPLNSASEPLLRRAAE